MWEKIVLNLVSNAFKFTLEGEIEVSLSRRRGWGEARRPRHRYRASLRSSFRTSLSGSTASRAPVRRTHEGTGIGLALVQELVKLHGGTVGVESVVGQGTTFSVTIPFGRSHLPADRISGRSLRPPRHRHRCRCLRRGDVPLASRERPTRIPRSSRLSTACHRRTRRQRGRRTAADLARRR